MNHCPECGNAVQEDTEYCPNRGADLTRRSYGQGESSVFLALLAFEQPQRYGLAMLLVSPSLGLFALFVPCTFGATGPGHVKEGIGASPIPWWASVNALGAFDRVVVSILNRITTMGRRALPSNGRLTLGGVLKATCALATHRGFILDAIAGGGGGGVRVWDGLWETASAGLRISLDGGILAAWASAIGYKLSSLRM